LLLNSIDVLVVLGIGEEAFDRGIALFRNRQSMVGMCHIAGLELPFGAARQRKTQRHFGAKEIQKISSRIRLQPLRISDEIKPA
jgi:hypothetical protein